MLIRNSMLSLRTDCPTADNRDRHEHDGNPALSAQPVLIAGMHAFHVPFHFFSILVITALVKSPRDPMASVLRSEDEHRDVNPVRQLLKGMSSRRCIHSPAVAKRASSPQIAQ
jgi:hypothetical protein